MQKNHNYRRLTLLIFVPPLFVICLCFVLLIPSAFNFYDSSAFPDYLWSTRITRGLNDKGYLVYDVKISGSDDPSSRVISVEISNLVGNEQKRSYDLVKEVHLIILETFDNTSSKPNQPANVVVITINDSYGNSHFVGVDYETVRQFFAGEISEKIYFVRWTYSPEIPEIAPK